ncbi:sporulation protein YqfD [Cohnella lubricantis]|uniref:Sporulation protein YqfD n=1 Tax=Cohnella lubricantis TaxID=2163172 RepID=A0A841TBS9_9BACL|nr:sporulation protein YqfD [Cohnella lubricantis]MBB6678744.1 sporulation protein YqfD [Cohnella lubricantis]MBP2119812.1 hypothetical protein [Cohnella lubricantis]
MKGNWLQYIRGIVTVKLIAGDADVFLRDAVAELELWDIGYAPGGKLVFRVTVPDFFRMRPALRRAGARIRIMDRSGLPFQMARLSRRKTFAAGMLGFIVSLYLLSTLVWDVQVEGTERIPADQILQAARAEGIYPYQWSFRLKDSSELASLLAQRIPGISWVGIDKQGTKVTITVVESAKPEQLPPNTPRDLIAKTDAVVSRIVAEGGKPKVIRNERVRKGDVLISGIVGEGDRTQAVVAKGEVLGIVWHEYRIVSPMTTRVKGYTGLEQERSYLLLGNRALQIGGYGQPEYDQFEVMPDTRRLTIGGWTLPFGIYKELEKEVQAEDHKLTEAEAKEAGLRQARAEVLRKSGMGAVIKAEKLLHEQTENGKVILNVLFEVEQSIAVERPIVNAVPSVPAPQAGTEGNDGR